jgi:hypothetical protein
MMAFSTRISGDFWQVGHQPQSHRGPIILRWTQQNHEICWQHHGSWRQLPPEDCAQLQHAPARQTPWQYACEFYVNFKSYRSTALLRVKPVAGYSTATTYGVTEYNNKVIILRPPGRGIRKYRLSLYSWKSQSCDTFLGENWLNSG